MIEPQQRTPEWRQKRVGMITGSVVGAVLGLDPFQTKQNVLQRMVLEANGYFDYESTGNGNPALEYGRFHEDMAKKDLQWEYGIEILEQPFVVSKNVPWIGASPDGAFYKNGERINLEIKCPFSKRDQPNPVFQSITELPHYYAQVQIEMYCTNTETTWFFQWSNHGSKLEEVKINKNYLVDIIYKLTPFYELFLSEKDDVDKYLKTEISAPALVQEYLDIKEMMAVHKERQDEIIKQLVERSGGKDATVSGHKLTKVVKKGAISYAKVVKEHLPEIDLEPYTGKPSEYWRLT